MNRLTRPIAALALAALVVSGGTAYAQRDAGSKIRGEYNFYGGAAGWCDADGDGAWVVAIRCAELDADGRRLRAWAGGGIVAASDPGGELAETTAKLGTLLSALDITI